MDLTWSAEEDAFRAEAWAWLTDAVAEWRAECGGAPESGDTRDGFAQHLRWERRLFDARWAVVSWAEEHGGRGASLWEWLLFEEEYYRAGCPPRVTQNGIFLLAPSIYEFGTPAQQDGILRRMAAAEDLWCQGWSEPNAGSDLASVASRARRVEGGWVLDGQKTWTTRGAFCTHLFGLFRSDPDSERHRGLTYLLVPLDTPGVTVRGFGRLDGDEGFAEVFFDDAFLADDAVDGGVVLGEPEGGWAVAMATAGSERGLTLRSPGRFLATAERLVELAAERGDAVLRRRAASRLDARRRLPAADPRHRHPSRRRRQAGRRGQPHQAVVERARRGAAPGRARPPRPRGRARGPVEQGLAVRPLRPDLRRHQRDPAQHRRRAPPGPPDEAPAPPTTGRMRPLAPGVVGGVRFALTDDQVAFRDAVRDLLAKECTPAVVRAAWDAPAGELDRGVWDSLSAMGVLDVLVPEDDGGLGLDETYLVPVLEAAGQAALPHPLVETAMVAAPLLGAGAGLVSSDLGGPLVPCAADADRLLLRHGDALVAVDRGAVALMPADTVDRARRRRGSTSAACRRPDGSAAAESDDAGGADRRSSPTTRSALALAVDRGALGTAAFLIGLGQAMLDLTVAYVVERHQFGKPIGSFQAVKHHLADAALAIELRRPAVHRAAWSVAHDAPTRSRDVSMAKAMASDAAELVGRHALQCHGAIGYTVEADLHLSLKRTWALARAWGDSAHHTDRVADALAAP